MLRKIISVLLVFICFLLQSTLFKALSFGNISPNLLIVLIASFGFMRGEKAGMLFGFSSGLICDIFFSDVLGFNALILLYIGYLNGKFSGIYYPEDVRLPMSLIVISDLSYSIIYYIMTFLLRGRLDLPYYFMHIILPEAVYTMLVTLVLYPLILWINMRLEIREKRGAQKFV